MVFHPLFSNNCHNQFPRSTIVAVFAEVYALPRSHVQPAIGYGNGETHTAQRRFGMCWHVITSFQRMLIIGLVFWHQMVEDGFHVHTHVRVVILIDAQSAARMLGEDIDNACVGQLRQLA